MSWTPTNEFLHGRLWKPFLPFEKHPNLKNDNFKNLYAGDEVYIFETKDGKWARGYLLTRPFPHDFTITSVNLDNLPGLNVKIVVFPLKYVKVIERLPLETIGSPDENDVVDSSQPPPAPGLKQLSSFMQNLAGEYRPIDSSLSQFAPPPLPFETFTFANDLVSEITYAMNLLMTHIFALYSIGEFRLFNKLSEVYNGLDENRIKLTLDSLTEHELQVARETTTYLLSKIPKKLASKSARLNEKSFDLENQTTDISAYKAVLARDTFDGSLLSLENASPAQLALSQQLCALYPHFPINAHFNPQQFIVGPTKNAKLVHDAPSHILVDFKTVSGSSNFQPSGFVGMIAYLYIRNNKRRLTEAFAVHTNSVEDLVFVEKISAALFRNIPASEVEHNRVFLVAVLTEEIGLTEKETFLPQLKRVKKGVAAGVTDITRVFSRNQGSLALGESHQFSIKLYGSFVNKSLFDPVKVENNGWGELVDRIIGASNEGVAVNPRAEQLVVSVKEFKHQLSNHEEDASVGSDTAGRRAPIAKIKPIFFDPLAENYERLYLKLGVVTAGLEIHKNALLTVEVSAPNDQRVLFAKASNQTEQPTWQFVSVYSGEVVGEIVKVNGITSSSSARTVPKNDSLALDLYANGVLIGRGEFAYKNGSEIVELNKKPWYIVDFTSPGKKDPVALVQIHTEYIGKALNKEPCIVSILQGESLLQDEDTLGFDELHESLVEFCRLDIKNLVRHFSELLPSLLKITDFCLTNSNRSHSEMLLDTLFKAIVNLLDTVFGKQDQYMYMFDAFIAENRIPKNAGIFLLNKIADIFNQALSNWNSLSRTVCRNISLIISLSLAPAKELYNPSFYTNALTSLFKAASFFVSLDSLVLINDQILVIEIPDYVLVFESGLDLDVLLDLTLQFIDSLGTRGLGADEGPANSKHSQKDHKIIITKLLLIQRLFASEFARDSKYIKILVSRSVVWCMEVFLGSLDVEASRLASSIINCVCDLLWRNIDKPGVNLLCFSLAKHLAVLSKTFIKYNKLTRAGDYFKPKKGFTQLFQRSYPFKEIIADEVVGEEIVVELLVELVINFVYVARIGYTAAGAEGYYRINNTYIENDFYDEAKCGSGAGISQDISLILAGIQFMRLGKYFPEEKWLSLYALIAEGCLQALELITPLMLVHFIPSSENPEVFDRAIWGSYFRTLLKLATLPPVSVEHLSTIPRKACYQITGRMRGRIAEMFNEAWDALAWDATDEDFARFGLRRFGGFQVEFIASEYGILQDMMLFVLQRNNKCQAVAMKVFWTILVSEYLISGTIRDVERECLLGLHDIYNRSTYKPGRSERITCIEKLRTSIKLRPDDELLGMLMNYITNLSGFMEVLNELNQVPVGPEFEADRTYHRLNINAYLKNANKPELFHSFISHMYEENVKKGDYTQAALSLQLLSSTYEWDHHDKLPASHRPKLPEQSSFERKETLTKMIAQNFIKGNSLEKAIDTYNELLDAYTEHTYDLKSFAYVHQKLAKLYLDLEASDKLSPSYFRVAYIGAGFPANIRGKEQIYEGLPFEHITSIHERLLGLYPGARIVTDDQQALELKKKNQTGRYLHVTVVEPVNEVSDKILNTSLGVRQYARNKNLRFFTNTRKMAGSTSVFDLWTEEITYETEVSFPTLMNRSEIKNTTVVRLSPLENAIRIILAKTNELVQAESLLNMAVREKADYSTLLNDMSRNLSGTVDAPVNGGVGQFRAYFQDPRYDGNPEYALNVRLLRSAFYDLASVLSRCLALHGRLIGPSMRASHDALLSLYRQNFKSEIEHLKISTVPETPKPTAAEQARGRAAYNSSHNTNASNHALAMATTAAMPRSSSQSSRDTTTSGATNQLTQTSGGMSRLAKLKRSAGVWLRI